MYQSGLQESATDASPTSNTKRKKKEKLLAYPEQKQRNKAASPTKHGNDNEASVTDTLRIRVRHSPQQVNEKRIYTRSQLHPPPKVKSYNNINTNDAPQRENKKYIPLMCSFFFPGCGRGRSGGRLLGHPIKRNHLITRPKRRGDTSVIQIASNSGKTEQKEIKRVSSRVHLKTDEKT